MIMILKKYFNRFVVRDPTYPLVRKRKGFSWIKAARGSTKTSLIVTSIIIRSQIISYT